MFWERSSCLRIPLLRLLAWKLDLIGERGINTFDDAPSKEYLLNTLLAQLRIWPEKKWVGLMKSTKTVGLSLFLCQRRYCCFNGWSVVNWLLSCVDVSENHLPSLCKSGSSKERKLEQQTTNKQTNSKNGPTPSSWKSGLPPLQRSC